MKIGLFGIGLQTYWNQFEGLKEILDGYLFKVEENLKTHQVNLRCLDSKNKFQKYWLENNYI